MGPIYLALFSGGIVTGFGSGLQAPAVTAARLSQASAVDTPPAAPQQPAGDQPANAPKVSPAEYEGWRQYSVNCARCHGQDVLPNPVAANLLISLAPGGPVDTPEKFSQVVSEGRPHRGMPAFKETMRPDQIQAVYAYVKGRAEKRITAGRPAKPGG
jgi:mono/diheme cytochrome c family protein